MNYFIKNIHINKLFHLENIDIPIENEKYPHLIITGKNGSGKTVLLNEIANFLSKVEVLDGNVAITSYDKSKDLYIDFINKRQKEKIIEVFYQADRKVKMIEPDSPQIPNINMVNGIRETVSDQFIKFLVDLKFQELLAISNQDKEREQSIKAWFGDFEKLLKAIFQKEDLTLSFDQKNKYSFKISTGNQTFGFNEMSDGFKAAINIVADLILKMQNDGKISDSYRKEGIVLIDEIETHLHLELQKIIMPFLTKTFPNIQFIVTTHSPFVLSSMENAVAFDLEHKEPINDLTDYSYSSLAEGFFGVRPESSTVRLRLDELTALLSKETLSVSEQMDAKLMMDELDKIPEPVLPSIVGEYLMLKLKNAEKIKTILAL